MSSDIYFGQFQKGLHKSAFPLGILYFCYLDCEPGLACAIIVKNFAWHYGYTMVP